MAPDNREIAASFDRRAPTYARNGWHKQCAERLVALCSLRPGDRVLDAGTGTGFAALAAARVVGTQGHVCAVDISAGMLREAEAAGKASGLTNVERLHADATHLPQFGSGTFDAITCAAGLLYMPVAPALREWHRLLKPAGLVAFSTMEAGSPWAGRIFRDCAAAFGVVLDDPSEPLGSTLACRRALEQEGFAVADTVREAITFSAQDLALAWESNFRSAAHSAVQNLGPEEQRGLRDEFMAALARESRDVLNRADILYALGRG